MPPDAHVDLAGIGLGIADELRNRLGRQHGIDRHDERHALDAGDRRDIAHENKIEVVVERRVDRRRRADEEKRVTVGGRMGDRIGADVGAGARPVLDNELLAEALRQPLADQTRDDVEGAAGRNADDDPYRPCRPGCARAMREIAGERRSTRHHMHKSAARKFHGFPPVTMKLRHASHRGEGGTKADCGEGSLAADMLICLSAWPMAAAPAAGRRGRLLGSSCRPRDHPVSSLRGGVQRPPMFGTLRVI